MEYSLESVVVMLQKVDRKLGERAASWLWSLQFVRQHNIKFAIFFNFWSLLPLFTFFLRTEIMDNASSVLCAQISELTVNNRAEGDRAGIRAAGAGGPKKSNGTGIEIRDCSQPYFATSDLRVAICSCLSDNYFGGVLPE
jgi:hypothetical protein